MNADKIAVPFTIENKKALIVGMARSGIEAAKLIHKMGGVVSIYDGKTEMQIDNIASLDGIVKDRFLGNEPNNIEMFDLIVLSPGVPTDLAFLKTAKDMAIEVIGEVELAYRFAKGRFIGITGTNGKTTTTTLVGEMFKQQGLRTFVVGNIGVPISKIVCEENDDDNFYITELSSYQLESIDSFKPWIAAILNITPDHLARHKTMANYIEAKLNIATHLDTPSHLLLNLDQSETRALGNRFPGAAWFSKTNLDALVHVRSFDDSDYIVVSDKETLLPVMPTKEIGLLGEHNLENALAAVGLAYLAGVSIESMGHVLRTFRGVEHRNEFVATINGVSFYNDSKATNPEASIPAIKAMQHPTVLIAGGMDKGSDYTLWIATFKTIKHVILFGETKYAIASALEKADFVDFSIVENLHEAIQLATQLVITGDNVLLSPACASWDMYPDFEARGDEFKMLVRKLEA